MKKIIVANWKSNKTQEEAELWLDTFKIYTDLKHEVAIAPPYPFLSQIAEKIKDKEDILLTIQDLSAYPAGSYTGEVCLRNLEGFGVKYAILGHSERRRYLGENHQDVANKVDQCLAGNITPIICIDINYLTDQASAISSENLEKCIVAYEPPTAISTNGGENASIKEVKQAVVKIREVFGEVRVIYGGNVTADNVNDYLLVTDGVLVGGASLDVEVFEQLVYKE